MREICFDTETTGLDPRDGHKVVEIGCVELIDKVRTGRDFHVYINPQREMPKAAFNVHGLSDEFLKDKPLFKDVAKDFIDFIGDAKLVAHNAAFDMKFINFELRQIELEIIERFRVVDSLVIARGKFPGAANSLDALCKRFGVDLSRRQKHGALLDSELLAEVYLELTVGSQSCFFEEGGKKTANDAGAKGAEKKDKKLLVSRQLVQLKDEETDLHRDFILKNFKKNFWYNTI